MTVLTAAPAVDTITSPPVTPVVPELPDLDPTILDQVGDELLLASAAATKVAKVKAGDSTSRAWSASGAVD